MRFYSLAFSFIACLFLFAPPSQSAQPCAVLLTDGIEQIVESVGKKSTTGNQNVFFLAVYGWPNSGKSFLISALERQLKDRGFHTQELGPTEGAYRALQRRKGRIDTSPRLTARKEVYLFHITAPKGEPEPDGLELIDPNIRLPEIGFRVDLNIGIFNPRSLLEPYQGEYDFLISNPDVQITQ